MQRSSANASEGPSTFTLEAAARLHTTPLRVSIGEDNGRAAGAVSPSPSSPKRSRARPPSRKDAAESLSGGAVLIASSPAPSDRRATTPPRPKRLNPTKAVAAPTNVLSSSSTPRLHVTSSSADETARAQRSPSAVHAVAPAARAARPAREAALELELRRSAQGQMQTAH
eukprot:COSAG02_NODE_23558_length_715_cov_0.952922_1_plen_169_part_10